MIRTFDLNVILVLFEIRAYGAWSDIGAKKVLEDAPKRLEASGWNNLRPALDVTVSMLELLIVQIVE